MTKNLVVRWKSIFWIAGTLSLVICGAVFGPLAIQEWRNHSLKKAAAQPTLQSYFESGELRHTGTVKPFESLLPYDSISFERGPCFGPCPVYEMTLYRDGRAALITHPFLEDERKMYRGKIRPEDYARLTQLVTAARNAAHQTEYAGQWTDDSTSTIRATFNGQTWQVSDYGMVAPPEVWALEMILHMYRDKMEWSPSKTGG
jgi:uncharacterized protein DUF6438